MRILITSDIFPPDTGGPASYVPLMAGELSSRGHDVRVLTYSQVDQEATDTGYPFELERVIIRGSRALRLLRSVSRIAANARRADVLYVNGLLLESAPAILLLRKPAVAKVVGDITWERARDKGWTHDEFEEFQSRRYSWGIELRRRLRNWALRQMKAVVVPSAYLKGIVCGWGLPEDRIRVIYNAYEPAARLEPSSDPEPLAPSCHAGQSVPSCHSEREVSPSAQSCHCLGKVRRGEVSPSVRRGSEESRSSFRVVTVCRLTTWKGVDGLIQAVAALPQVELLIVGDGPERTNLEALSREVGAARRVHFAGQVPRQQVSSYLRGCDLFVLNSRYEGLPHVLLEAMSAGLPVIAADAGGCREVVSHGLNGLLVPPGDAATLRAAIQHLIDDPEERRCLVQQGEETLTGFSVRTMIEQTEAALRCSTPSAGDGGCGSATHAAAEYGVLPSSGQGST